jgi:NAD(P)H-flavin reductase/hemoglobin-like flavoprotein
MSTPPPTAPAAPAAPALDPVLLKRTFDQVARYGDTVIRYFYNYLFLRHPDVQDMFPASLSAQRDRLFKALIYVVSHVDRLDRLVPYLQGLGRDHRKFQVHPEHYPMVGEALLATLRHFLTSEYTPAVHGQWAAAYELVAAVMQDAASAADRNGLPSFWDAEVIEHERHGGSLATFTVATDLPYPYLPGQSVSLTSPDRPGVWRNYCPANAPNPEGTLTFHVRSLPGGWLSPALVHRLGVGDRLRLGPPVGRSLTLVSWSRERQLLLLAGGTGRAPLQAVVDQLATDAYPPTGATTTVLMVVGARSPAELYRWAELQQMTAGRHWITVQPVVDQLSPAWAGQQIPVGRPVEIALDRLGGNLAGWEVYLCGPPAMVAGSVQQLQDHGVPGELIHIEDYVTDRYVPTPTPPALPVLSQRPSPDPSTVPSAAQSEVPA